MTDAANELPGPRPTITTNRAAEMLGVSRATVIRLCTAYEEDREQREAAIAAGKLTRAEAYAEPLVGIEHTWTSPNLGRVDANGNKLRGHRKLFLDSVIAFGESIGVFQKSSG